jgi:hypothetical protein
MGIVLRRSTTDWTWLRLLRSVARSMVAFMSLFVRFFSAESPETVESGRQ